MLERWRPHKDQAIVHTIRTNMYNYFLGIKFKGGFCLNFFHAGAAMP